MTHKFLKKKKNFHFPKNFSKKDALRVIQNARIYSADTLICLDFVCADYENIIKFGYHTLNRGFGFYNDYSEFL